MYLFVSLLISKNNEIETKNNDDEQNSENGKFKKIRYISTNGVMGARF